MQRIARLAARLAVTALCTIGVTATAAHANHALAPTHHQAPARPFRLGSTPAHTIWG